MYDLSFGIYFLYTWERERERERERKRERDKERKRESKPLVLWETEEGTGCL